MSTKPILLNNIVPKIVQFKKPLSHILFVYNRGIHVKPKQYRTQGATRPKNDNNQKTGSSSRLTWPHSHHTSNNNY